MVLFSKQARCFYCGSRPTSTPKNPRRWKCRKCAGTNYLDEQGNACHPPVEVAARFSSKSYAVRPEDSDSSTTEPPVFCSTCQKNQHIVREALSGFMSDVPDDIIDRKSGDFQSKYSRYRQELEGRYPQVCENCAVAARKRISEAQYLAKSDYLRQMLHKEDDEVPILYRLLRILGAAGHYTSFAGQLIWDMMGVLSDPSVAPNHTPSNSIQSTALACIYVPVKHRIIPLHCSKMLSPYFVWVIWAGWFSLWWNPLFARKLKPHEKVVGLRSYYTTQIAVMLIRHYLATILDSSTLTVDYPGVGPCIHAITFIVTFAGFLWSRRVLRIWIISVFAPPEAMGNSPGIPSESASTVPENHSADPSQSLNPSQFPIAKLHVSTPRTPKVQSTYDPNDDVDAMDWTPIHKSMELNISLNRLHTPQNPTNEGVRGADVSAPVSNRNQFTGSTPLKRNFTSSLNNSRGSSTTDSKAPLKPPSFYPPNDYRPTGLETLFGQSLKISDENGNPTPKKSQLKSQVQQPPLRSSNVTIGEVFSRVIFPLLAIMLWFMTPYDLIAGPVTIHRPTFLMFLAGASGPLMADALKAESSVMNYVTVFVMVVIWFILLALHIVAPESLRDHLRLDEIECVFMMVSAIWGLISFSFALPQTGTKKNIHTGSSTSNAPKNRRGKVNANARHGPEGRSSSTQASTTALSSTSIASKHTPTLAPASAPAFTSFTSQAVSGPFRPVDNLSNNSERGQFRTENVRPATQVQPKPYEFEVKPQFPPPPVVRGGSPLRSVRENSPYEVHPGPFTSTPNHALVNSSFTSLSRDILSPPSPSETTVSDDSILDAPPDSPSRIQSNRRRSLSVAPLAGLSLDDEPTEPRLNFDGRYNLRSRKG